jgi:hypothetical protein
VEARLPNDCAFFALGDVCACTSEDMLGQCVYVCVVWSFEYGGA